MRLKEIKPGMVIHCKNDEEKQALLEEAERLGYRWYIDERTPTDKTLGSGYTIHFHDKSLFANYKHIKWSNETEGATEFSDLILPEPKAEEVWNTLRDIPDNYLIEFSDWTDRNSFREDIICGAEWSELVDLVNQWKADHSKKEPEIETVDICRIIEIMPDGKKRCVHEEDIKAEPELPYGNEQIAVHEILKRYCMEHDGDFIAVHEVVSRVKK